MRLTPSVRPGTLGDSPDAKWRFAQQNMTLAASSRQFIASLAHGIAVLEALASDGPELNLAALARRVRKPKPTTWRLVHTLVSLGYVRQDPDTRRFALAPRILALGACFDGMDVKELAAPFLRDLSARVKETVNMAVRDEDSLIYIERIKTSQVISINLHVGSRLPLYNTSMGRALIAHMPDDWLGGYVSRLQAEPAARPYAQRNGARLLAALGDARRHGYALNDEELVQGLRSAASPIWDGARQKVVAAINIAVPSARITLHELVDRHVPELLKTASSISTALTLRAQRTLRDLSGRMAGSS
jgi:IclR family pca regulon transcriptional regulator